jgi:hypothetical protein
MDVDVAVEVEVLVGVLVGVGVVVSVLANAIETLDVSVACRTLRYSNPLGPL